MSLARAEILIRTRRYDDAERALREALRGDPGDARAHLLLAQVHLGRKETDAARREAGEAIRLDPDDAVAFLLLAAVEQADGDEDAARDAALEARRRAPTWAEPVNVLARREARAERWAEALSYAEEALGLDPENEGAGGMRALALTHLGRRDEAAEAAKRNLELDPQDSHAHVVRGMTLLHRGEPREARAAFLEALRLDPGNDAAREGLVLALKASSLVLRPVFAFFFWMTRIPPRLRLGLIVGAWLLANVLGRLSEDHPSLKPWVFPLIAAYGLFCLATWVADPLMNLALRLHPTGRHALSRSQRLGGTLFAAAGLLAVACVAGSFTAVVGGAVLLTSALGFLLAGVFGSAAVSMEASKQRRIVSGCALTLAAAAPLVWVFEVAGLPALSGDATLVGAAAAVVAFFTPLTRNLAS